MVQLHKESEQHNEEGEQLFAVSTSQEEEEEIEPMVTPKGTCYLSNEEKHSPDDANLPRRVQSTQSLLGLIGLEGHEESEDDEISMAGISAVTEEQEVMDIVVSPTSFASPSEGQGIEDATCNTTPPGSVQGPGILSLSPPRLTTYSVGSVTSASITDSFVLQPRQSQSMQRQNHLPHESPRFTRSPLVHQPPLQTQPQPRSRPPRAPHHSTPGGNNSVGCGPVLMPRAVMGTGSESLSLPGHGGGHSRTPTDATNYSFLSSLTDASGGEYGAPRRRTLSWDNNENSKRGGNAVESKSLGVPTTPGGSILQPILMPADQDSTPRPPMSISAYNLRKVLPVVHGPTATTPTRTYPSSSSKITSLVAPSSLPSGENLHPLIQNLHQNVSHSKNPLFISPPSHSKDDTEVHPLIRKLQESSPSKSGHTMSTSASTPFRTHVQDEKKDDDSSHSRRMTQYKAQMDRKSSDYWSFSSSFCSSSTVRLQKKTSASPGSSRGAFERQTSPQRISENSATGDSKHMGWTRFGLADIVKATRECNAETDILDCIERKNSIDKRNTNYKDDTGSVSNWPYLLLVWGMLSLGSKGFVLNANAQTGFIFVSDNFVRFCLVLGAAAVMKKKLSEKFLDEQIMGQYWNELTRLRNIWVVLDEIAVLSTKKEDDSAAAQAHIQQFCSIGKHIGKIMDWNSSLLFEKIGTTRENFIESAQIVYEGLARRNGGAELSFESICEVTKLPGGSSDRSKVKILSDLFCPSRQGHISKFDFVKSTDCIFKATTLLRANISHTSEICQAVDHVVNTIFYAAVATLAPSVVGVGTNTLLLALLSIFAFTTYVASAENLKGIFRLITQKSFDIGDRVYFFPEGTEVKVDDGPPSGGWIVENIDLYKTTLRQGITGERSIFSNKAALFCNSRVVNWKRSHKAVVRLSMEFSGNAGSDKIDFFRRQISEWIEDHPCEWTLLDSFRMVDADIHQQSVKYDLVLRHRESWCNYTAVQDSKSDILVFLRQLRKSVEA